MARGSVTNGRNPVLPTGTEVASFKSYQDAIAAVEVLGAADFPLPAVSIVGSDLHIAEQVMGKLTPGRVALAGAGQGLTWGLLMGVMSLVLFPELSPLAPIMAITAGIVAGILMSVVSWSLGKGRRSFAAQSQLVASRYAILVSEQTDRAFKLLQSASGNLQQQPKVRVRRTETKSSEFGSRPGEEPKFGVRLTPSERRAKAQEPSKSFTPPAPAESTEPAAPSEPAALAELAAPSESASPSEETPKENGE